MQESQNENVLDFEVLKGVTQNDPEFELEFIQGLIRNCEALFEKMVAALNGADLSGFVALIHQYRGVIQYVAASHINQFVIATDDKARLDSTPPSDQEFEHLQKDFFLVKQALDQHVQALAE